MVVKAPSLKDIRRVVVILSQAYQVVHHHTQLVYLLLWNFWSMMFIFWHLVPHSAGEKDATCSAGSA